MTLLILESIGTQELVIIGMVALMFLGPRKLPEYARKIGKMMAEFRSTTSEFKETWQREVNFEEESKALRLDEPEIESSDPMEDEPAKDALLPSPVDASPAIKAIDREEFDKRVASSKTAASLEPELPFTDENPPRTLPQDDKRNWL